MNCDTEATEVIVNLSHIASHLWALVEREVCLAVGKYRMDRILPLIHYFIQAF